jgi:hypothetical protein
MQFTCQLRDCREINDLGNLLLTTFREASIFPTKIAAYLVPKTRSPASPKPGLM